MILSTKSLLRYLQPNAHIQAIYSSTFLHTAKNSYSNIKPYDQIPSKSGPLPASIDLLLSGGADYLHEHCDKRHKQLGPIYRDYLGNIEIVFLADTKLIQTVVANEGQHPRHNVPEAWSFYNELHNIERGLFFQMGEPWSKLRKVFNKVMLADPRSTASFTEELLRINDDLLDSWKVKFDNQTAVDGCIVVPDIKAALCNWSIESTGCMLFGSRMGCVPVGAGSNEANVDPRANELVKYVTDMFIETANFQIIPVRLAHKLGLGAWKRFDEATTGMLRIANLYAAENLEKVSKDPQSKSMLADIMKINTLSRNEISRSLVDLIIAAADTTSAALQWMIYLLAKQDQNLQSNILSEVNDALVDCGKNAEKFKENVPLLKAFIRESLRLYPTAPFLARTLDHDIVLNGYKIPAGKLMVFTLYTTSRMDKYFDEPLEFRPERWLRSSSNNQQLTSGDNHISIKQPPTTSTTTTTEAGAGGDCPHLNDRSRYAYASLPFGIGARMCVGRRAAELQMMTFLASFVRKFKSELSCGNENDMTKVKLKMILAPTKPISIKLTPR